MKGSEVQELAQRVAARSRCYVDLFKALQNRYGQQRTVYQHYVRELLAKRKYDYNQENLQELVDHFNQDSPETMALRSINSWLLYMKNCRVKKC